MVLHSYAFLLVRDPSSVPDARKRVRTRVVGCGLGLDESTQTALDTITSELVTNAVRHTDDRMLTVAIHADSARRRVLIEVHDGSIVLPCRCTVTAAAETGRGMLLVEHLAAAHGSERLAQGKRVWAELALPDQVVTRRQILAGPRRVMRTAVCAMPSPARLHGSPLRPEEQPSQAAD